MRLEFSRKTRAQGDVRCQDKCELCGMPFAGKKRNYHHVKEANDGGDNSLSNMLVICEPCHKPLTKQYVRELRKAERIRDKHTGAWPKSRHPMRFGRDSPEKMTFHDGVVLRQKGQ